MPSIIQEDLLNASEASLGSNQVAPEVPTEQSSFIDTVNASFKRDNTVFNVTRMAMESTLDIDESVDPDFDPFDEENIAGYELDADAFINVKNRHQAELVKVKLDYDKEQQEILSKAPTWSAVIGGIMANTVDPLMFIPVSKTAQIASRSARTMQGVATGVGLGATAGISREGILQAAQEKRELDESVSNILVESAFGGMFGGIVGSLANPVKSASKSIMSKALRGEEYKISIDETGKPFVARSVGAAESTGKLEDEGLAYLNENVAKWSQGPEFLRSPTVRGLTSEFETTRSLTNGLFLHNFILNKNIKGQASGVSAEALMRQDEAAFTQLRTSTNNLYFKHTGQGALGSTFKLKEGKLKFDDFNGRVAQALRNENIKFKTPEINEAAVLYRTELDNITKRLQENNVINPELDLKVARNYFSRIYDTKKLLDEGVRSRFLNTVGDWLQRNDPKTGKTLSEPLDKVDADDLALKFYDNIMKEGDDFSPINKLSMSKFKGEDALKEDGLLIPDSLLDEFLVNDAQKIAANFYRKSSSILNVQKTLNDLGFDSFGDIEKNLRAEFDSKIRSVSDLTERQRLKERLDTDIRLTEDMYKIMTGNIRRPGQIDKYVETLMQYQYVRLLGGVTLSSLPELAMQPFRFGLMNTFRDGFLPMIRDFKASKLTKDQYKFLDVGLENEQSNLLRSLSDPSSALGSNTTEYERMMEKLLGSKLAGFSKLSGTVTDTFSKASLINYWTAAGRRLSAQIGSADIMRTIDNFAKTGQIDPKKVTEFASIGIDKSMYNSIAEQINKHGIKRNGSWISNIHLWDNKEAQKAFSSAVQRQVESVVIKPSKGDIPIIAQENQLARLMFQFKSFSSGASNKILLSALQRRDATTLNGLFMLAALGSLSGITKDKVAGRESDLSPDDIILDGISRSGMTGLLAGTILDFGRNLASDNRDRYAGKFAQGAVIGPSFGMIEDTVKTMQRMTDGEVTDKDAKAALRLLPFNNLFYIQAITNKILSDDASK